jgi:PAS domain S-box-containing protein
MAWSTRGVPERGPLLSDRLRRPAWLWLVPALSLALTAVAWHVTRVSTTARASARFGFRTVLLERAIDQRLASHVSLLRGVVGLFDASGPVPFATWNDYLRAVHPETSTPGLQMIGFSERVRKVNRGALERQLQGQGWPFAIWAAGREEADPIVYAHPFERDNLGFLGFDMSSDPVRREAMTRARDFGIPALSGQVPLIEKPAGRSAPGFIVYLPVYHHNRPTDSLVERRAALRGFVFGAFRAQDLISNIFSRQQWDIDFELYDGAVPTSAGLLYRSEPGGSLVADREVSDPWIERAPLEIAGHRWLLVATPSSTFLSFADRYQHWLIASGGVTLSLLAFVGLWASSSVRKRAVVMAEGMSQAFKVSEAQSQMMVDSITDHAIFRLDAEWNVTSWNASAERMLGYTETEAVSRPASRFWVSGGEENPYNSGLGIVDRQVREGWHVRKDGHRFWGAAAIAPLQRGADGSAGYVVILRDDTSRRQAIEALAATSAALEQRTIELGRFNRLASGRELRMIELKRMVNERSSRLGMEPPFDLSFADDFTDVLRPGEPS